jgi:serine/threonine protein kinase/Tol biopolymer transport system component
MTPEKWQRIEGLFHAALDRPPNERAAFLAEACGADAELRGEVIRLLDSLEQAGEFIEQPLLDNPASAAQPEAVIGQRIGNYEILSLLGAGGMGEVYLAHDVRLDRQIALKLLPAQFTSDAQLVRRFEREARAASALNHPNIITIYEIGQDGGKHFIATELIAGQTLREKISAGKLKLREALMITTQVVSALEAAHAAGIIHRDIKPENVMVRPDGLVKLLDFGLAKPVNAKKLTGELKAPVAAELQTDPRLLMGTLAYLAPEQARGESADQRTDLFSLGVVFYEMLTGARPFDRHSSAATLDAILHEPPAQLAGSVPGFPAALDDILGRVLEKDRQARYQSAAQFRHDLKELERELDAPSSPAASLTGFNKRWKMAGAALTAALLVIAGWVAWPGLRNDTPSAAPAWTGATAFKLTDQPGEELFPSLSPDGQFIVYASRAAGNWDIWRQRVSQRASEWQPLNLTKASLADETQPIFSPDGKWIAFASLNSNGGISVMDAEGKQARRLTAQGFHPSWSADGREIYCTLENVRDPDNRSASVRRVWAIEVATGRQRLLFTDDMAQPGLSPHGHRFAYWGAPPGSTQRDIWTRSPDGKPVAVTSDPAVDWNPLWSPDGRYLYFASNRAGSMNLWRVAIDERTGRVLSEAEQIPTPASYSQHATLSGDGRRLAFVELNRSKNLYRIGFDPVRGRPVGQPAAVTRGSRPAEDLALSPDGEWLAFVSEEGNHEDIFLTRSDGSGEWRNLTNDRFRNRGPVWSPDGNRIAFYSDYSGSYEIWAINVDGSGLRQMTNTGAAKAYFPFWSEDGQRLVFTMTGGKPAVIEFAASGAPQPPQPLIPAAAPDMAFWPRAWSADGKRLVGRLRLSGDDNYQLGVYSFESRQFQPLLSEDFRQAAWLGDNRRLALTLSDRLWLLDTATGKAEEILALTPSQINRIGFSRDNRLLYFSLEDRQADIWMLTQN